MATRPIRNLSDLGWAVARIGRRLSSIAAEEARARRSVEWHQSKIDQRRMASAKKLRDWKADRDETTQAVFDFVDPQRAALITGKIQSFDVGTGIVGYDEGREGATAFPLGEEAAVKAILERLSPKLAGHILKQEVRKQPLKDAIRDEPELAVILADVIDIPTVDRFVIKPANSEKGFRRPLGWFHRNQAA